MILGSVGTGIMLTYLIDGPIRTKTRMECREWSTANGKPFVIPVPGFIPETNINDGTIVNDEIDDRHRYPIDESPRHIIDSNQRLYNEIPVAYPKPSFKFPRIRFGRDLN